MSHHHGCIVVMDNATHLTRPAARSDAARPGTAGPRPRALRVLAGWSRFRREDGPAVDRFAGDRRPASMTGLALAAEDRSPYRSDEPTARSGWDEPATLSASDGARPTGPVEPDPPFGVRVLTELPEFAGALEAFVTADARMLQGIVVLARLLDTGQVEETTGLSVEQWLGIVGRQTRMDRRLLLRLCRLLSRFPALADGVEAGTLSYAQLRGLGIVLRPAPADIDAVLNDLLGRLLAELQGADPEVLVSHVRDAIVELSPRKVYDERPETNRLWIQPNLDRTGGRFGGQLNTLGLAIMDEATAPDRSQRRFPGGAEAARAHNLLAYLSHPCPHLEDTRCADTCHTGCNDRDGHGDGGAGDDADAGRGTDARVDVRQDDGDHGDADVAGPGDAGNDDAGDARTDDAGHRSGWMDALAAGLSLLGDDGGRRADELVASVGCLPAPKLLLRAELATLLDGDRLPVAVLTRLTGGQLRLSSEAARRLVEARGAEVRTIIVDQGEVVGVGRASRQPPGWLSDIVLAVHDTCSGPLCDRPARGADVDHARPWWPDATGDGYGTTDADNLGPLCPITNERRHEQGWHVAQHPDGRRTWTHRRTGLTVVSVPSTWRPPGWQPPDRDDHRPPAGANGPPNGPPSEPADGREGPPDGNDGAPGGLPPPTLAAHELPADDDLPF
jgi:hypothetical protein